jgi:hypothetical protein
MSLALFSERFRPEGGAVAQAMSRALGTPKLDNISVLIREAVQNSWDARKKKSDHVSVSFKVRIEKAGKTQVSALRKKVFAQLPNKHPLEDCLEGEPRLMFLEDRGTVGLGGPVFMEPREKGGGNRNFINFFRLFGRESEVGPGGGTYGYGKAVFFNASRAATILVHTKCLESDGSTEERLMGMSLWRPSPESLETGRHWWGVRSRKHDGAVGPASGRDAADLAEEVGFRPFGKEESGTSIMVFAPRLVVPSKEESEENDERDDPIGFAKCMAESMAIWFWPRMLGAADGGGKLRFSVSLDGTPVEVPDPKEHAPLSVYALALEQLVGNVRKGLHIAPPHVVHEITSIRPTARLGWLSLVKTPAMHRRAWAILNIDDHAIKDQLSLAEGNLGALHHIALIRSPGQVIRYLPCRQYPDGAFEYGGVFLVEGDSEEVDKAFALAEPPSHDDWVWEYLKVDWHRRYVRIGLKGIKGKCEEFAELGRAGLVGDAQDPLGALSSDLGELISAPGSGAQIKGAGGGGGGGSGGGGGGRGDSLPFQYLGEGSLELWEGEPALIVPFKIEADEAKVEGTIRAHPRVLVAGGGKEGEAPQGAEAPRVLAWCAPDGRTIKSRNALKVRKKDVGDWRVVVSVPKDTMVGVVLEGSKADPESEG